MRPYSLALILATSCLVISSKLKAAEQVQPNEAFLEFLASMDEVNGEITDPLDMLEVVDEPELIETKSQSKQPKDESKKILDEKSEGMKPNTKTQLVVKENK